MNIEEFRTDLLERVRASAEAYKDFRLARFVEEAAIRLADAEEVTDFEGCRFEGSGARSRKLLVNGYAFDESDGSVTLVVADYSDADQTPTLGSTDVKKSFGMLMGFAEEALSGRLTDGSIEETEPGFGLAHDLLGRRDRIERFRLYLITDKLLSMRSKDLPQEEIDGVPAEFHVWDIERFHLAHESATGRDDLEVDFAEFGGGLPCLRAGGAEGEYSAYLCIIPGKVLADVYDHYGSRLLEGNVRSFLSVRGSVNKGIRTTVLSRPEMFFAYNNGISATAEAVSMAPSGKLILAARNFQIVNGGQTTASLALAKRKDRASLDDIFVQMKLSVLPPERSAMLIPEIAKFANSQNKINEADFFSNHPYHIRLEEFSRRIWAPAVRGAQNQTHWFYERARGQYLNEQTKLTKGEKNRFQIQNPRDQVLTKTDVAKLENTWRELPHKVSLGAQKNFREFAEWISKRWETDETQFHEEYFKKLIALGILFRQTEKLVGDQAWYQSGYRANIVTYALAKLHLMIEEQGGGKLLDLRLIWDRQSVPAEVMQQLTTVTKETFGILTAPDRLKENVTEWAKMEACWSRVRDCTLPLSDQVQALLANTGRVTERERAAKKQQVEDDGIAAQTKVLQVGADKWRNVREWATTHNLLTPKEAGLLAVAADIPRKIPSDKQAVLIWDIRTRLIEEGCPVLV
jgi:hypothetical protein